MKNIKVLSVCAMIATAGILQSSCKKYLEQPALGHLNATQVNSIDGINGLLIGAYSALDGGGGDNSALGGGSSWEAAGSNWIYGSVAGGDAHKGSDGTDQPAINSIAQWTVDPTNGFLNTKWKATFEGITRCNNVLKTLAIVPGVPEADQKNISAQARFLRAHYYFELKKMFNKVPWVDETTTDFMQPNTEDIWPKIVADFQYAYDNLPAIQSQVGRVNKWAAGAYLAKSYLYQKKYPDADPIFTAVITSGTNSAGIAYGLTDAYEDNFDATKKNNKETVFAIQQAANDGTNTISEANNGDMLNYPYNKWCCGFFQPTMDLANSFRTNADGLPYIDTYNEHPLKTDQGVAGTTSFTPDENTVDPRLDWTVGRRGIPYLDWGNHPGIGWIRLQSYAGPYSPKKNMFFQATKDKYSDSHSWAPGTANQINVIRFADVLLMAAEVKAQLGQLDAAQTYVNMVRTRAGKPQTIVYKYRNDNNPLDGFSDAPAANYLVKPYPAGYFATLGGAGALKAIYFERKIELGMEGQRFFDISRWGIAEDALNTYYRFDGKFVTDVTGAHFTAPKNNYFPIPQAQIDLEKTDGVTSKLEQNPGYN